MAEFGKTSEPEIPFLPDAQESLEEMIGTSRSRVSFLMNRFLKPCFIDYNGRILVHSFLLNWALRDQQIRFTVVRTFFNYGHVCRRVRARAGSPLSICDSGNTW